MTDTHRFSVSVSAAVTDDEGRFLCIQRRDNGHWEPPGGVVDPGETLLEALVREVEEETGFVVSPGSLSGVYQNMQRDIVALVFRCDLRGGEVRATEESARVAWLTLGEVEQWMEEAYATRLLDARKVTPTIRAHDGHHVLGGANYAPRTTR